MFFHKHNVIYYSSVDWKFDFLAAFPQDQCHAECVGCCSESAWECKACRHMKTTEGKCVAACSSNEYAEESERVCRVSVNVILSCAQSPNFKISFLFSHAGQPASHATVLQITNARHVPMVTLLSMELVLKYATRVNIWKEVSCLVDNNINV